MARPYVGACLFAAACAGTGSLPTARPLGELAGMESESMELPPPLRFVDGSFGRENSKRKEPMVVPFGVNQDGTELMMVLVHEAAVAGAAYVGDVELISTFRWKGTPVECRKRVVFADDLVAATAVPAPDPGRYGTQIEEYRPRKVTAEVDGDAFACREVVTMIRTGTELDDAGRSANGDLNDVEVSMPAEEWELAHQFIRSPQALAANGSAQHRLKLKLNPRFESFSNEVCEKHRVKRQVERHDYEVALGFIPPDWTYLSRRFADRPITTAEPVCYQVAELHEPIYRVTATAFYRGAVKQRLPTRRPSDDEADRDPREFESDVKDPKDIWTH